MTTPPVLKRLSEFPNIKLKIYVPPTTTDGFHAKGYLFHKSFTDSDQWTVIIGSSNITGRALKTNVEWNVLQNEATGKLQKPGIFAKSVLEEFEQLWKSPWAKEYSDDFLISYRDYLSRIKKDDDDELKVIFTVDLFNEGIDIPSVNTILMLRPTESSIIFIQQLGRELRKLADKEFVTVLDFIGNYNKSFLMAIALNGKQNFDKDSLKVEVETDFANLPNGTYIHMDKIAFIFLAYKICEHLLYRFWLGKTCFFSCFDAFQNPCHIAAKHLHYLYSLCIF